MVRGLKYCASYNCCSHRYKDRDDVGCFNIYRKTRIDFPDVSPGWEEVPEIHELSHPLPSLKNNN
jgi:hypothetical protein